MQFIVLIMGTLTVFWYTIKWCWAISIFTLLIIHLNERNERKEKAEELFIGNPDLKLQDIKSAANYMLNKEKSIISNNKTTVKKPLPIKVHDTIEEIAPLFID